MHLYSLLQATPLFKDEKNFSKMVDPLLRGQYPKMGLYYALAIASRCVVKESNMRPVIAEVVAALDFLASKKYEPQVHPIQRSRYGSSSSRSRAEGHRRVTSNVSEKDRLGN